MAGEVFHDIPGKHYGSAYSAWCPKMGNRAQFMAVSNVEHDSSIHCKWETFYFQMILRLHFRSKDLLLSPRQAQSRTPVWKEHRTTSNCEDWTTPRKRASELSHIFSEICRLVGRRGELEIAPLSSMIFPSQSLYLWGGFPFKTNLINDFPMRIPLMIFLSTS